MSPTLPRPLARGLARFGVLAWLAVSPVLATTLTFRQDDAGYAGTQDTFVAQSGPNANNGNNASMRWDGDDPNGTGQDDFGLLRFDGIIGSGAGQVPSGSLITSATLTYNVSDTGNTAELHFALGAWTEATTFTSYCSAGCDAQVGALGGTVPAGSLGVRSTDVTSSVQAWANGSLNNGWIVVPTGGSGVEIGTSENATQANRPLLTVVYDEGPPPTVLVRYPYLQLATPTSLTIVWRSETASDSRVRYGTTLGSPTQSVTDPAVTTNHIVTIAGLTPQTRYYYDVGTTTTVEAGGTAEYYFDTSPVAGASVPFRAWVLGDSGTGGASQLDVRDAMLAYTGAARPDMLIHVGDIAYSSGTEDEFTDYHFGVYQDILRHTVSWPTLGNHEGSSTTSGPPGTCTGPYYDAFVLPSAGEAGGLPSGTEAYYSFDRGDTHFISLNSTQVDRSATGAMATWLQNDLAATSAQWIVAFWHHPPYSRGTHNSDVDIELIEMRENLLPILEAGGVDLVLSGHSHAYERSYLIDGTYTTPTPDFSTLEGLGHILDDGDGKVTGSGAYQKPIGVNAHEGTVYVVAGHGGATTGGSLGHPVMYFSETIHGSCILDVNGSTLTLTNIRDTGAVSDTFTIIKGEPSPKVSTTVPPKSSVLGSLVSIQVTFTADVVGVDAFDLTVNGSIATALTTHSARDYTFSGFAPPGNGPVTVALAKGGIVDAGNPALLFGGDTWTYTIDTNPPSVASEAPARGGEVGVLPSITVNFTKPVNGVVAADLLVNGQPATTLSAFPDSAGPYLFKGFPLPDTGLVTVTLLSATIEDDFGHPFAGDAWTYTKRPNLVINEFLTSNTTSAADEYGEYDDYVEIYNPAPVDVAMGGMYLTDSLTFPSQYRIPDGIVIPAKGRLVFWCDSQPTQGPLHTNFNLQRAGESIGLYDTEANEFAPIDSYTWTNAKTDISLGRFPDGAPGFVSMPPTEGTANTITCGTTANCSALNGACTSGVCSSLRCVAVAANEGGSCDDGIACLSPDTCTAGVCGGGVGQCTAGEVCNLISGQCQAGSCTSGLQCSDGNPCTDDQCVTGSCIHGSDDANVCSDGIGCTADSCSNGACVGTGACPPGQTCDSMLGRCESPPLIASFQEGYGGYASTQDTFLAEAAPNNPQGALDKWRWDTENPAPNQEFGLLRFDDIVGTGSGKIPAGAAVSAATLSLVVSDASSAPAGTINEAAVSWAEGVETWNSFGGEPGVQADEYRPSPVYVAPIDLGPAAIDVTESVNAWVAGARPNYGWIFRPQSNNSAIVRSAEAGTPGTERPKLTVTYVFTPPCVGNAECDDGNPCTGTEVCVAGACQAGTPMLCGDNDPCTADWCTAATGCGHTALLTPSEITNVHWEADKATLSWDPATAAGPGTVHDVARGVVRELPVGSGSSETCLRWGLAAATTIDARLPALNAGFWYDVRGRNTCATGTYGWVTIHGVPTSERITNVCP